MLLSFLKRNYKVICFILFIHFLILLKYGWFTVLYWFQGYSKDSFIYIYVVIYAAKSFQSCSTLCDPMDCNPPGSSVRGILQARILELGGHFPLQNIYIYIYIHTYIYVYVNSFLDSFLLQVITRFESSSLHYTAGFCWLSILYSTVYILIPNS